MRHSTKARLASTLLLAAASTLALPGCVMSRNASGTALQPGEEATISGRVVAIDTDPWAYDGNAVIQVATEAHGIVKVDLPARWNLCAAPAVDVAAMAIGDEVTATGSVAAGGTLVVCANPAHRLVEAD